MPILCQMGYSFNTPQRQCTYYFPQKFPKGTLPQPNVLKTNLAYDGWNVHIDRLFFANGKRTFSRCVALTNQLTSLTRGPMALRNYRCRRDDRKEHPTAARHH